MKLTVKWLCLWLACCTSQAATAQVTWPEHGEVFAYQSDTDLPLKQMADFPAGLDKLKEMPTQIVVEGQTLEPQQVDLAEGAIDLEPYFLPYGKRFKKYLAIVFFTIDSPHAQSVEIGAAADWYMQWSCNGQEVYSTMPTATSFGGNDTVDYSPGNHIFSVPLKQGRNLMMVKVVSGAAGFKLYAAVGDRVREAKQRRADEEARKVRQLDRPASVRVDFDQAPPHFVRSERYNAWASYPILTRDDQLALYRETVGRQQIVRVWLHPLHYYDHETDRYTFPAERDDYLRRAAVISEQVMIGGAAVNDRQRIIETRGHDHYAQVLARGLKHYKQRYPGLVWIEGPNEPEVKGFRDPTQVYRDFYKPLMAAVRQVNAELEPDQPLRVGGPVNCTFMPEFLEGFLAAYAQDPDPDKRLDFISYHQYLNTIDETPNQVQQEYGRLQEMLRRHGLPEDLPIFITESGIFPGFAGSGDRARDRYTQAAGLLTLHYHYQESSDRIRPFQWVNTHPDNDRKDQFERDRLGLTPYGLSNQAKAMLKSTRVAAEATPQTDGGLGLYAVATADASGAAVLIWNYQYLRYDRGQDFDEVTVELANLPQHLAGRRAKLERFEILPGASGAGEQNTLQLVAAEPVVLNEGELCRVGVPLSGMVLLRVETGED